MNRRSFLGALGLGGFAIIAGASAARADHEYRSYRYYRGRDREEIRQRETLRFRLFDIADRIRLAEREGDLPRWKAGQFYRRLDDVRDFLREDHHLSDSEFGRRRDDLNDISRDFAIATRRFSRYDRDYRDRFWDRRDRGDRYDRDRDHDDRDYDRGRDRYDRY